jgi:purine-binding chemotaxis protein CheW
MSPAQGPLVRATPSAGAAQAAKDWQQLRERLARTRAALEESQRLSPERARAILEERARLLARVPTLAAQAAEMVEVLIMALGPERYAVPTEHLREVFRFQEFTPLPGATGHLLGIINVRGQILALFDLANLLGVTAQPTSDHSRILVLGEARAEFGVVADAVYEVARLRTDEIFEAPGSVASSVRPFLRGVTEQALLVLDGAALLQDPRLFIDQSEDDASGAREKQA